MYNESSTCRSSTKCDTQITGAAVDREAMIQWQIQTVTGQQQQQQHLMAPMYKHTTTFDTQCVTFDTRHCLPIPLTAAAHSSPAVDRQTDRETDKQTVHACVDTCRTLLLMITMLLVTMTMMTMDNII